MACYHNVESMPFLFYITFYLQIAINKKEVSSRHLLFPNLKSKSL